MHTDAILINAWNTPAENPAASTLRGLPYSLEEHHRLAARAHRHRRLDTCTRLQCLKFQKRHRGKSCSIHPAGASLFTRKALHPTSTSRNCHWSLNPSIRATGAQSKSAKMATLTRKTMRTSAKGPVRTENPARVDPRERHFLQSKVDISTWRMHTDAILINAWNTPAENPAAFTLRGPPYSQEKHHDGDGN